MTIVHNPPTADDVERSDKQVARKTKSCFLANQLSRKLLSTLDRLGCLSFRSALASICQIRSRVTKNC